MSWFVWWAIALVVFIINRRISSSDEVYRLILYTIGIFSLVWGFAMAPIAAQVVLEVLILAWAKT
ncbi:MAG: hypothetical protein F6K09_33060, partial [Merismopedia sp. SIO2A8]|nr:hypothetical protein [Merismopedia sp. SIO2A8]